MSKHIARLPKAYRYSILLFILFFSFSINVFGVGYGGGWFGNFQSDSSIIVEKTAQCKGAHKYNGPIVPAKGHDYTETMSSDACGDNKLTPYVSQFGLQARVIALFAPDDHNKLPSYYKSVELALAFLSASIILIFLWRIERLFGGRVAGIVCIFIALSPWLVAYAHNMYWVFFVMVAPFVFSFVAYGHFKQNNRLLIFYTLLATLLFIKFLNGYEHASTVALSALAAIAFTEMMDPDKHISGLLRPAAGVAVVSVVALMSAILINIADLSAYTNSWSEAVKAVTSRAGDRASGLGPVQGNVILGFEATAPNVYGLIDNMYDLDRLKSGDSNPLVYAVLCAINYIMLPAISLPIIFREPAGEIGQSVLVVVSMSLVVLITCRNIKMRRALIVAILVSIIAALSWLVLMPGHAYPHAHLNGIIFYLPLLLFAYVVIGCFINNVIEAIIWKKHIKK